MNMKKLEAQVRKELDKEADELGIDHYGDYVLFVEDRVFIRMVAKMWEEEKHE